MTGSGTVYLVGAGPGDPGLITMRGMEILRTADCVVYDRLVNPALLAEAREDAELIDAGKRRGDHRLSQDEINAKLIRLSRGGSSVCRLKGGDPFVFGRGGEEALALAREGLPWEVVPGIPSPVAGAAYAGVPITQRGMASSFTIVTGSEEPGKEDSHLDWQALARNGGTLAFVMGWKGISQITESLVTEGLAPDTPSALVQWGTTARQRTVTGPLDRIVDIGTEAGIGPPVIFLVGEVVTLREQLRWFDSRPLFGKRILITRARSQASRLAGALRSYGAETLEVPAIEIVPVSDHPGLDAAINSLSSYDWVAFTSPNGVHCLLARMHAAGLDARGFCSVNIAAVGPATARALEEAGLLADLVPDSFDADALVHAFRRLETRPRRVLFPRSNIGREALVEGLRDLGIEVDAVTAYENRIAESSAQNARKAFERGIDMTTFTSSSSVENLVQLLDGDVDTVNRSKVACIGPVTAGAASARGIRVDLMAHEQTIDGLVSAIISAYEQGGQE